MEIENKGLKNNKEMIKENMQAKNPRKREVENSLKTTKETFQRNSNERGITLVALVITIVILIILAVVAINAVFGDSGLLKYAQDAKNYQANADTSDAEMINDATSYLDSIIGGGTGGNPSKITTVADAKESGETFEQTTELEDDSGDSVWIPGGFHVTEDSATDADNGVVIKDEKGNEFVWVPVPDYTTMYIEAEGTKLSGEEFGVTTTTGVYSKLRVRDGEYWTPTIPGSSNFIREPDTLIDVYDGDVVIGNSSTGIEQIKSVFGYSGTDTEVLNEFLQDMVTEYTATYDSIKKYKGFYIGRYELTGSVIEPTVEKGQEVLGSQNWYSLKKACSNVVSSEYAQSEMIYGNQWDEVMNWLKATVFKDDTDKVDVDSSSWGNYKDSTGEAATNSGAKQPSGTNEAWKANNIYDLAGNCDEWTQEAESEFRRVIRGGPYYNSGSGHGDPASDRDSDVPWEDNRSNYSSRPTLYIKLD